MKYILTVGLLCFHLLAFSQNENNTIIAKTDKLTYSIGETISIRIESEDLFRLSTTGDCNGSLMSPTFIKKVNGEWTEPNAMRQLCCGLPYSKPMMKANFAMNLDEIGYYKIAVFTGGSIYVLSNVFEIIED